MIDVVDHQLAPATNPAPGDGVIRITLNSDSPPLFHFQEQATAGVAKTAVTPPDFAHGVPSLGAIGHLSFSI
jgi:hypothetical protein